MCSPGSASQSFAKIWQPLPTQIKSHEMTVDSDFADIEISLVSGLVDLHFNSFLERLERKALL